MKTGFNTLILTFLTCSWVGTAYAQPSQPPLPPEQRLQWFKDAKFGIFVHWGAYAVIGRHEWIRQMAQIPQAQYDTYAKQFNPMNFNADAWVELAKNAGARYMVITSKHHDGFSIYRSKVSDYDMEITPYPGDPLKQLAAAAKAKGIKLGFYHSIMDWHNPDYRPRRAWEYPGKEKEGGDNNAYVNFMEAQLKELLTEYGDVAVLWFDGEWEHTLAETGRADEVYDMIRTIQPNTLINDRLYERKPGSRGDFGTPEQFVPATGFKDRDGKPVLWEACVTINGDSWGYNRYETDYKTDRDLIRMLIDVVSKGGNLLLNIGPKPDGVIPMEFVTRLNAMGRWLDANGEAIYGTTPSPFERMAFFGRATTKGEKLFLEVYQWPQDGVLRVPGLKNKVRSARLLAEPGREVTTAEDQGDLLVKLPGKAPDDVASVIELTLDGPPSVSAFVNRPNGSGTIVLGVDSCEIRSDFGQRAKKENLLGHVFLTQWTNPKDVPYWTVSVPKAGKYTVEISYASDSQGKPFAVEVGGQIVAGKTQKTGSSMVFKPFTIGSIVLPAGKKEVRVSVPASPGQPMNLEKVTLRPAR